MHIVIPDDYQNAVRSLDCFRLLADHEVTVFNDTVADVASLMARFHDADALVLIRERTRITPELLGGLPRLKLISQTGKISSHLDLNDCTAAGVAVAEGVGSPVAPAEFTWALIMAARRHLSRAVDDARAGRWQTNIGYVLKGSTLGIWGYGKIGRMIAAYGKAFGMRVVVWGSEAARAAACADGYEAAATRAAFFVESDVVTLHLRLAAATRAIVTFDDLRQMKPTALFVNTSRAELVAPGALARALDAGRPGYAALDVYEDEPITDPDYPLFHRDNVVATPHLGYVERSGYELYFEAAFRNVVDFFRGQPQNIANPSVLTASRP